jgi:hypothetical protein
MSVQRATKLPAHEIKAKPKSRIRAIKVGVKLTVHPREAHERGHIGIAAAA